MVGRGGLTRTVRTARLSDIEDEANRSQIEARADATPPGQNVVREQNANVQVQDHETWRHMLESFMKMKPPKFNGSADSEDWKENVENLLDAMDYTQVQKQRLAILCLIGDASLWWKSVTRGENAHNITWEEFCRRFDLRFFPPSLRQAKARKFLTLKQGSMTVLQYETQFTRLARLATHMHLDEFQMARQFEEGLHDELRLLVKGSFCQSLREVSDLSTYLEQDIKEHSELDDTTNSVCNAKEKEVKDQSPHKKPRTETSSYSGTIEQKPFLGKCYRCGSTGHKELTCKVELSDKENKRFTGKCFRCGRAGHKESTCQTVLPVQEVKPKEQSH
ncbi:Cellular nucleic acid-binding protein [Thalictrum thalictroides]|uniref:Cellular nucleic acid-binding protein n=1 Tax=Thalictrum thalictroides TaxID=46969 RepID=A0A7J6X6A2_THATH|nr:Cellular nucleic acid-binding protein [Thalictrum thalictroides]